MEKITVIRGLRQFWGLRIINWLATRKAEHLGTFLALLADDPSQVIGIYLERGLVGG